jgi:hypothetical protein
MGIQSNMSGISPLGIPPQITEETGLEQAPVAGRISLPFLKDSEGGEKVVQNYQQQAAPALASPFPNLAPGTPISILDLALIISTAIEELKKTIHESELADLTTEKRQNIAKQNMHDAKDLTNTLGDIANNPANFKEGVTLTGGSVPDAAIMANIPADAARLIASLESTFVPLQNGMLGPLSFSNLSPITSALFNALIETRAALIGEFNSELALFAKLDGQSSTFNTMALSYNTELKSLQDQVNLAATLLNNGVISRTEYQNTVQSYNQFVQKEGLKMKDATRDYNFQIQKNNQEIRNLNLQRATLGLPSLPMQQPLQQMNMPQMLNVNPPIPVPSYFLPPSNPSFVPLDLFSGISREALNALYYEPIRNGVMAFGPLVMLSTEIASNPINGGLVIPHQKGRGDPAVAKLDTLPTDGLTMVAYAIITQANQYLALTSAFNSATLALNQSFAVWNQSLSLTDMQMGQEFNKSTELFREGKMSLNQYQQAVDKYNSYVTVRMAQEVATLSLVNQAIGQFNSQVDSFNAKVLVLNIERAQVGLPPIAFQQPVDPIQALFLASVSAPALIPLRLELAPLALLAQPPSVQETLQQSYINVQQLAMNLAIAPLVADAMNFSVSTGFPIPLGALQNLAETIVALALSYISFVALQNSQIETINQAMGVFTNVTDDNKKIEGMNQNLDAMATGKTDEQKFNKAASSFNSFVQSKNQEIATYNIAATLYNAQVASNNQTILSMNIARQQVGLPLIPFQVPLPLQQPLSLIPLAPFDQKIDPLQTLVALAQIATIADPPTAGALLALYFNPVQAAALSLVGLVANDKLTQIAQSQILVSNALFSNLSFVYPKTFIQGLSSIFFAQQITSVQTAAAALSIGIGSSELNNVFNRTAMMGVANSLGLKLPPSFYDQIQLLALQTIVQAAAVSALPTFILLGDSVGSLKEGGVALQTALSLSFLHRISEAVTAGVLLGAISDQVKGEGITGDKGAVAASAFSLIVGFSLLQMAATRIAVSLGLPGLMPQLAAQVFGEGVAKEGVNQATTKTFMDVFNNPISLLYLKAALANFLVLTTGLSQPISDLKINAAINQLMSGGVDFKDEKTLSGALLAEFGKLGISPADAKNLADVAMAQIQLEMLSPFLNVAFVLTLELSLLTSTLQDKGVKGDAVNEAASKTLQNPKFETMRDFALAFMANLAFLGISPQEAVAIAVLAVEILATEKKQDAETSPLQSLGLNFVLTAQVLRELLVAHVISALSPELGVQKATSFANEVAISLLGALKGKEDDEDPIASMKALLKMLQDFLAQLLSGQTPKVDIKKALGETLGSAFNPGADFSFVLEKILEPAEGMIQTTVGISNQGKGEIAPIFQA